MVNDHKHCKLLILQTGLVCTNCLCPTLDCRFSVGPRWSLKLAFVVIILVIQLKKMILFQPFMKIRGTGLMLDHRQFDVECRFGVGPGSGRHHVFLSFFCLSCIYDRHFRLHEDVMGNTRHWPDVGPPPVRRWIVGLALGQGQAAIMYLLSFQSISCVIFFSFLNNTWHWPNVGPSPVRRWIVGLALGQGQATNMCLWAFGSCDYKIMDSLLAFLLYDARSMMV